MIEKTKLQKARPARISGNIYTLSSYMDIFYDRENRKCKKDGRLDLKFYHMQNIHDGYIYDNKLTRVGLAPILMLHPVDFYE